MILSRVTVSRKRPVSKRRTETDQVTAGRKDGSDKGIRGDRF